MGEGSRDSRIFPERRKALTRDVVRNAFLREFCRHRTGSGTNVHSCMKDAAGDIMAAVCAGGQTVPHRPGPGKQWATNSLQHNAFISCNDIGRKEA